MISHNSTITIYSLHQQHQHSHHTPNTSHQLPPLQPSRALMELLKNIPKIDSIDEIVEKYNPILSRSTRHIEPNHHINSNNTQSHPKHLSPSQNNNYLTSSANRHRCISENSDDSHSSINSLTREALALQALLSHEAERESQHHSASHNSNPPFNSPGTQTPRDADSISKRSTSPICRSPLKKSLTTATTEDRPLQTQVDDQIALYLRSTRLTTLIKLQRQQSPMTVSLADVGSSIGHPVFVFLGLGCVRYLVGLYDELAEALGLRLICIDRWGLGKTTEVPDEQRGFLEWASVVEEVADQLEIHKFSILAHSAGAPYALACSLRFGDRVHGSIHLLAPWVSMTAEGGINAGAYKWLKYIPNSMIKTVQAAEWKMTGWRLGKPPSLNHPPVGFDARAPVGSHSSPPLLELHEEDDSTSQRRDDETNELDEINSHRPSPSDSKKDRTADEFGQPLKSRMSADSAQVDQDWQSIGTDSSWGRSKNMSRLNSFTSQLCNNNNGNNHHHKGGFIGKIFPSQSPSLGAASSISPCHSKSSDPLPSFDPKALLGGRASSSIDVTCEDHHDEKNFHLRKDHLDSVLTKKVSSKNKSSASDSKSPIFSKKPEDLVEDGGRRGHNQQTGWPQQEERRLWMGGTNSSSNNKDGMEEGKQKSRMRRTLGISLLRASYSESLRGGTSDLITILEKNSKPWGFSYAEISKPVKIWHGDKDERLSPKGSQWFINSITSPKVKNDSALFIVHNATHSLMTDVSVLYQVFESIADQRPSASSSSDFSL
ncbi:hypothetical protein VP01_1705g2 [Puccinia sorghi]|uniref:AB hydrolase-1 domain-containing protein n=1 Tax=Puccinia sorghi TaxID=27349 RepID=A0A0L6VFI2_9BASI|nr:hypothetical protein VP01_1705g2 [Puccinia sorghi]